MSVHQFWSHQAPKAGALARGSRRIAYLSVLAFVYVSDWR